MLKEFCYDWFGYNQQIFSIVNLWLNNNQLSDLLSIISTPFFIGYFAIIYCILTILAIYIIRSRNSEALSDKIYDKFIHIGCSYALFGFIYAGFKFGINLPRPYCSLQAHQFLSTMNFESERCLSSFPSAHTGMAAFITYFLWPYLSTLPRLYMMTIVVCVGSSRIASAMHYPADILYGALLAIIVIKITEYILAQKYVQFINNRIKMMTRNLLLPQSV